MASNAAMEKQRINQAIQHAQMMHREGMLSDREMAQFTKKAIAHAMDNAIEDSEYDGMVSSGQHDRFRNASAYDDNEDPDVAEQDRHNVVGKVIGNWVSDPMKRHLIGKAEIDTLKQFGLHPGNVAPHEMDQHLDDLYLRSTEADRPMHEPDHETEAQLKELERGNYGERRTRKRPAERFQSSVSTIDRAEDAGGIDELIAKLG